MNLKHFKFSFFSFIFYEKSDHSNDLSAIIFNYFQLLQSFPSSYFPLSVSCVLPIYALWGPPYNREEKFTYEQTETPWKITPKVSLAPILQTIFCSIRKATAFPTPGPRPAGPVLKQCENRTTSRKISTGKYHKHLYVSVG